jgi:predicted nucleotidyltransferase
VTEAKVAEVVRRLVKASRPKRIILFGSAARGAPGARDADLLVVTQDEASSDHDNVVGMYDALVGVDMPVDLVVVPDAHLRALADVPGYVVGEALRGGVVLYDAFSSG